MKSDFTGSELFLAHLAGQASLSQGLAHFLKGAAADVR